MNSLRGQNAIVTGGAVRLGRAMALELARAGVNVCIHYGHSSSEAEATLAELKQFRVQALAVQADFTSPVSAAWQVMQHALQHLGPVDILVNSAAIFEPATVLETTEDQWDRHFDINLKAPFFLSQQFAAQVEQAGASIVNIIDWRGSVPVPGHPAYTLAKAALAAQVKLLAQEFGPKIRVNGIAPGAILPAPGTSPEAFAQRALFNPLQQVGGPADIVRTLMFLLQSPFVTGEIVHISGGEQLAAGTRY